MRRNMTRDRLFLACAVDPSGPRDRPVPPAPGAAQSTSSPVIYLDQAWSEADREWYYHFSQGSAVISYDIFLNLELANSQELVRSNTNSERYGLSPRPQIRSTTQTACRSASARQ